MAGMPSFQTCGQRFKNLKGGVAETHPELRYSNLGEYPSLAVIRVHLSKCCVLQFYSILYKTIMFLVVYPWLSFSIARRHPCPLCGPPYGGWGLGVRL